MAKFRKMRRSRRGGFRGFARKAARRSGVGNSAALFQLDAMLYGAARQYTSNAIAPITAMIPLGGLSDEVGMAFVDYMIAKHTSGMLSNVAKKGLVIENARVGEAIVQGGLGGLFNTSSGQTSSNSGVYGL